VSAATPSHSTLRVPLIDTNHTRPPLGTHTHEVRMCERLATDVFDFAGVKLSITRRDLAGPGSDCSESDDEFVDPYFFDEGYTAGMH
jgi:hypothetical protein